MSSPTAPPLGGGAHCCKILMASSTAHLPAANSLRDHHCHCLHCRPRCLSTLMSTSHPPAATASHDGCHRCCPCLPSCCRLTPTSHPSTTIALGDRLHPCLPPRHWSTSRINVDITSYRRHRHARSLLSLSSPSLYPTPVDIAHPRLILPPPPPCTILILFVIPVPVPVPVPAPC
jgi:hypothetical protein